MKKNSVPSGRILVEFYIEDFLQIRRGKLNLFEIEQLYHTLYMKIKRTFLTSRRTLPGKRKHSDTIEYR
jgi:hypothetical protein